jgi:predicted porin
VPKVLDFGVSVAAGEGVAGRSYSMDIAHRGDNYEVGALYLHVDAAARIASTGLLPQEKVTAFGGNVAFGPVRPYLAYFDSSLDSTVAGRLTQKNKVLDVGVNWSVTSLATIKAAYYDDKGTNLNGIAGRNGKKKTTIVSGQYLLSKRTEMYAAVFQNSFTDGYKLDPVNQAALNRNAAASSVRGFSVGMSHSF